jgi:hypothetical protein
MRRMSWKSGSLNLLEPSGPHRACYGSPLPLPLLIEYNHAFISFTCSPSEVWPLHFVGLSLFLVNPIGVTAGGQLGTAPPPQYCFCISNVFWGGLLIWREANKTWDESGEKGCMFIKNWFKLLFFGPIHQNGCLKIITYYCRARYNFVSMCRSKPSSTEWMPSPNYLWIHSVVYVYQNARTRPPFSRSVSCQRPDGPVVSFRVKNIKHIFSFILSSFFHTFFFIISFHKKTFICT